ncbi:MAG: HAD-IB family hydrolase [Actinomycetota bacterium]|jgi:HAD superfamily hydrolase (TIGR01490 family)|nr:HAD-IB family hydrolase [Euzebyaceae bacterium]MDQ3452742.1 HAD-IB family hydrolase [Actinomycetota bacterium]
MAGLEAAAAIPAVQRQAARQAAFFDLDKTVIAKSSTLALGRPLYKEGLISPAVVVKSLYGQLILQLLGANAGRMERWRVSLLELTRGWDAERVQRVIREVLAETIEPLIYAEALDLFDDHRRAGRDLYLVSSSGIEVVKPLAEYLGVAHVLATRPGIDADGRYDGTLDFYCHGENKAVAIRGEAEARGIDLDASYAYSDSVTDLPMLTAVGHPVVVNPDRALRRIGRQRGWDCSNFVRPVALRGRLATIRRPARDLVAGAGAMGAVALAGWCAYQRRRPHRLVPEGVR